jgi:integrase
MATVQKRKSNDGKTRYRVQVRLKGFAPQTATFKRKTDAEKWASATESAIREGRYFQTAEARKHTVAETIDRYLSEHLPISNIRTAKDRVCHLNWWSQRTGDIILADLTPAVLTEKRSELIRSGGPGGKPASAATANRYMASLSHVISIAVREWGWMEISPFQKVSQLKEPRGRVRFLSDDERTRLLDEVQQHSDTLYTVVVLALSTGARQGEIMGLRWQNVELGNGVIRLLETKNNERRAIPLRGYALDLMRERARVRHINTDLVFPSAKRPLKPLSIHKAFREAVKRAGIEDFRFHDLRHTAASYLAMNGATLAEIADVLGHKTLQMVKRYAHLSEQHTASVVERMNTKMFGGNK